jgi:type IV pilus assembly protein PilP
MGANPNNRANLALECAGSRVTSRHTKSYWGCLAVILVISSVTTSCDDSERTMTRGLGGDTLSKTSAAAPAEKRAKVEGAVSKQVYSDDHFVESDLNRDPFRSFTSLFKSVAAEEPQRTVIMATTAIENMKLIAIISGVPSPKAMLVDSLGVGHIVERGMYLGRPEIVRASENVSMTLNWRVHRIRENEVVLTRADPTDPNRPPLTRVIPLRESELVATR